MKSLTTIIAAVSLLALAASVFAADGSDAVDPYYDVGDTSKFVCGTGTVVHVLGADNAKYTSGRTTETFTITAVPAAVDSWDAGGTATLTDVTFASNATLVYIPSYIIANDKDNGVRAFYKVTAISDEAKAQINAQDVSVVLPSVLKGTAFADNVTVQTETSYTDADGNVVTYEIVETTPYIDTYQNGKAVTTGIAAYGSYGYATSDPDTRYVEQGRVVSVKYAEGMTTYSTSIVTWANNPMVSSDYFVCSAFSDMVGCAILASDGYTVSYTSDVPITVTSDGETVSSGAIVDSGAQVDFTVDTERQVSWTVNGEEVYPASSTYSVTVTKNLVVSVSAYYTLTFDSDGGSDVDPIVQLSGTAVTAPEDPTKEGSDFAGWNPSLPSTMPAEDRTYTATWTAKAYSITYELDGGTNAASNPSSYTSETETIVLADASKTGYDFEAWFDVTGAPVTEIAKGSTGDITLYATYTPAKFTITFDSNGGTEVVSITAEYGSQLTAPESPTRTGYEFLGWNPEFPSTMPAEDITLVAMWAVIASADEDNNVSVDLSGAEGFVMPETAASKLTVNVAKNMTVTVDDPSDLAGKTVAASLAEVENTTSVKGTAYEFDFSTAEASYSGKMLVKLPYTATDGKEPAVYYVTGDGKTAMEIVEKGDGYIVFSTTHNSTYVVGTVDSGSGPSDNTIIIVVAVAAVLVAVVGVFVFMRTRGH